MLRLKFSDPVTSLTQQASLPQRLVVMVVVVAGGGGGDVEGRWTRARSERK